MNMSVFGALGCAIQLTSLAPHPKTNQAACEKASPPPKRTPSRTDRRNTNYGFGPRVLFLRWDWLYVLDLDVRVLGLEVRVYVLGFTPSVFRTYFR